MIKKGSRYILIIFIAIAFLFVSACAIMGDSGEIDHKCMGEECSVCAFFSACSELDKLIGFEGAERLSLSAVFAVVSLIAAISCVFVKNTPVSLKVKLSD